MVSRYEVPQSPWDVHLAREWEFFIGVPSVSFSNGLSRHCRLIFHWGSLVGGWSSILQWLSCYNLPFCLSRLRRSVIVFPTVGVPLHHFGVISTWKRLYDVCVSPLNFYSSVVYVQRSSFMNSNINALVVRSDDTFPVFRWCKKVLFWILMLSDCPIYYCQFFPRAVVLIDDEGLFILSNCSLLSVQIDNGIIALNRI